MDMGIDVRCSAVERENHDTNRSAPTSIHTHAFPDRPPNRPKPMKKQKIQNTFSIDVIITLNYFNLVPLGSRRQRWQKTNVWKKRFCATRFRARIRIACNTLYFSFVPIFLSSSLRICRSSSLSVSSVLSTRLNNRHSTKRRRRRFVFLSPLSMFVCFSVLIHVSFEIRHYF